MRLWAVACAILLFVPVVGSLWRAPSAAVPALPSDLSDADLMRVLATKAGYHVAPASRTVVPPGATLPGMMQHLASRMGQTLSPTDLAPFAQLDPRVSAPTLLLLVAVDQAWSARDEAFSKLTPAEQQELMTLTLQRNGTEPSAREQALSGEVDMEGLINAAIALDDTLEAIVMPQLQQAVQAGAWPPIPIADPGAAGTGVLRLGSPGNDVEGINRIVQIDPSGDDVYWNNAGGTTLLQGALTSPGLLPIAISVDMGGNDRYSNGLPAQGGGWLGIGIILDYAGNDYYACGGACQGGAIDGVGLLRDYAGNDTYAAMGRALGSGTNGLGIARDDGGNDFYRVLTWGGGYAEGAGGPAGDLKGSVGLLWDRGGVDDYSDWTPGYAYRVYGWARGDSLGMMVDEGPEVDNYAIASAGVWPHGCNMCTWTIVEAPGILTHRQTGNDGEGGLAAILSANGR